MVPQHHAMFSLRQLLPALLPAAIVLSCLTVATQAGPADCELNKVALARVVTQDARLHFIAGASKRSCPSAGRACSLRAYLVPGDEVLVDAAEGPYVCAFFKAQHETETRAWLPRAALQIAPPEAAPARQWPGKGERDRDAQIGIKADGVEVEVSRSVMWGSYGLEIGQIGSRRTGMLERNV